MKQHLERILLKTAVIILVAADIYVGSLFAKDVYIRNMDMRASAEESNNVINNLLYRLSKPLPNPENPFT